MYFLLYCYIISPMEVQKEKLKNTHPIRWMLRTTKPFHGWVVFLSLLSVISAAVSLWNAVLLKDLIDIAGTGNKDALIRTAVMLGVISLLSVALSLTARYFRERISYRLIQRFQSNLFATLLKKDYYSVTRFHSQEWMNRLNLDSSTVSSAVCTMVPGVIGMLFHFIGALYLIAKSAPSFLLYITIGATALVGLNYALKKPLKQSWRIIRHSMGQKDIFISEHLSKYMIVKAFDREEITAKNSAEKFEDLYHKRMHRLRLLLFKDGIQNGSTKAASLAVLLYCAFNILRGEISYGTSVMLLRLLSQIRAPLTDMSTYISNIFDVSVAAERLMEAESFPDDPNQPVKSDEEIRSFYVEKFKEILFRDAGFSYLDELEADSHIRPTVFEDVNLSIPKKSLVAFTGMTGSGKSTLFKLLMSLYPLQEGEKLIVCQDGSQLPLDASFRRLFAYVPQGNQLMAGTIREMVSFGEAVSDDAGIWDALKTACARDFVEALPQGLDTQIGEKGLGLSEGQLQRLAIARAVYTKRPILLLDEATSSLDEATERALLENFKAMTDRTILIVTHRPAALSICDREVYIDGNRVGLKSR